MLRTFAVLAISYLAGSAVSLAQDTKEADKEEPTYVKVEVRGLLRVTGKFRKIPELEAPRSGPRVTFPRISDKASITTGITIETQQLGIMEVYLGGDEPLHKMAEELDGKAVVLSGDLNRLTFVSDQDRTPVRVHLWNSFTKETVMMPSTVTKTFVRGTAIKPSPR